MAGPGGPLAAFGHMQRALREADFRTASLEQSMTAAETTHERAVESLAAENRTLRQQLSDLQELSLQMFEEHEEKLKQQRDLAAAQQEQAAAQLAAHEAALNRSAKQLETLTTVLQRQEGLLDEHIRSSAAQSIATKAQQQALGTQQTSAAEATHAHSTAVAERLGSRLEAHVAAHEAASKGWQARFDDSQALLHGLVEREGKYADALKVGIAQCTAAIEKSEARAAARSNPRARAGLPAAWPPLCICAPPHPAPAPSCSRLGAGWTSMSSCVAQPPHRQPSLTRAGRPRAGGDGAALRRPGGIPCSVPQ
jgi:hypothetical protein